ncbi:MAG: TonB-dependent receptor plug domain-containing protein [Pseudomonadota bacterium]
MRLTKLAGASVFALLAFEIGVARAQDESSDNAQRIQPADEIVVQGEIGYRNRTDATEPTLQYGEEYFQRFEPLTAGDALKRVPSVTFLSDVIEADGARLRGLDPGYTQILINGDRVPGSGFDRSFFLDRIPAELIDRVEIVRSSSARRTGDAVAGTLNIVLRDGFALDGGYVRGGALRFDDGKIKETAGLVWGGEVGPGRLLVGVNVQGRYNPKEKLSLRYGDSPENNPTFAVDDFDNREDQSDIRDGRDYSFNANYEIRTADDQEFEIGGFLVITDRTETERSYEYDDPTAITLPVLAGGNLLTDNSQIEDIDQTNYSVSGRYERDLLGGRTKLKVGYAVFDEDSSSTEEEIDFEDLEFGGQQTTTDLKDEELNFDLSHQVALGGDVNFIVGGFYQRKDRAAVLLEAETDITFTNELDAYNQFINAPAEFSLPYSGFQPVTGGDNRIEEDRLDAFALLEGAFGRTTWEVGLRYESTDVSITDRTGAFAPVETDYDQFLPSAHLKFDVTDVDRITISGARTVRRPNFDFISPALLEAELGDNDLLGNPLLGPETAWGGDVGYERRLGRTGIVGVNFFYRAVEDLIEVANTGVEGSEGPGTFVLTPRNSGDGEVYGVEFDLSTPLSFVGLPDTGFFANVTWLDSNIDDIFGSRRFNDQSKYIYNVGVIHDFPVFGAAFGVTYRKQGDAFGRIVGEEVTTSYGADLEVFAEKRFAERFTIRFVGSNLLNGSKDEIFNKFDTIDDQITRSFDEYELETEQAGPWFQLVGRLAF